MKIQKIENDHWHSILDIQDQAYQDLGAEDLDVLKSKHSLSPDTCFVCLSENTQLLGYLLAHPWSRREAPKLFEPLSSAEESDCLFLHDMAVRSVSKGQGVGRAMLRELIEVAKQKEFKYISLVAVQKADSFWLLFDFHIVPEVKVSPSYGDHAVLMEKILVNEVDRN